MYPSILVVDDEDSILRSLDGILHDEGFQVVTAESGSAALRIIKKEPVDLVLLDFLMGNEDTFETLKELKKNFPGVPVVLMTGHGTIEMAVKAVKLGAFHVLEKPLLIEKMLNIIDSALSFQQTGNDNTR